MTEILHLIVITLSTFGSALTPPIIALETASVWAEGHQLALWSAPILGLCAWFVSRSRIDISNEALR